jgi:hypothetical protein
MIVPKPPRCDVVRASGDGRRFQICLTGEKTDRGRKSSGFAPIGSTLFFCETEPAVAVHAMAMTDARWPRRSSEHQWPRRSSAASCTRIAEAAYRAVQRSALTDPRLPHGMLIPHHQGISNQILDRLINIIPSTLKWNRTEVTIGDSTIGGRVARRVVSRAHGCSPGICGVARISGP